MVASYKSLLRTIKALKTHYTVIFSPWIVILCNSQHSPGMQTQQGVAERSTCWLGRFIFTEGESSQTGNPKDKVTNQLLACLNTQQHCCAQKQHLVLYYNHPAHAPIVLSRAKTLLSHSSQMTWQYELNKHWLYKCAQLHPLKSTACHLESHLTMKPPCTRTHHTQQAYLCAPSQRNRHTSYL
jgi:hypothetical protein